MSGSVDLSGTAFGNVDTSGCAPDFIAYLDRATDHFRPVKQLAHSLIQLEPAAKLLDVGCGCGADLRSLAASIVPGGSATGIDRSQAMIREARRRSDGMDLPLRFVASNAEDLPFDSNYFDVCRADRVFQHLPNPQRALDEMMRVVKPGGRVLVVDRDWGMVTLESNDAVTTAAVLNRACEGIRNGRIGRALRALFDSAGMENTKVLVENITISSFEIADVLLDLRVVLRHAVTEERVTEPAALNWFADLIERDFRQRFSVALKVFIACGSKALS